MSLNCKQVLTPVVDNSDIPCLDGYKSAACVILEKTAPYIGITTDDQSLEDVVEAIVDKLKTQSQLISNQNSIIASIEGVGYNKKDVTTDYTALVTDHLLLVSNSVINDAEVSLPLSSSWVHPITIVNTGAADQDLKCVDGGDTVLGGATHTLTAGSRITLFPDGTDFIQIQ